VRHILVGISDPGQSNRDLLGKAASIAVRSGARIHLVHSYTTAPVFRGSEPKAGAAHARTYETVTRTQLERLAGRLRRKSIRVETAVVNDMPPHEALVRQVRLRKADLLMVQLHRHPRWSRWFMTYTDWELIRQNPCALWLAKAGGLRPIRSVVAAVDPMHFRARAAKLDDRIVETAKEMTRLLGGRVTLCHAADLPLTYEPGGFLGEPVPMPAPREIQQRYLSRVEAALGTLARRHGLPAAARKITPGIPADLIPRFARELRANLLVMGAVSRSGLDRLFVGNTAERIIDQAPCDLLIVKPRAFRSSVPARRRVGGIVMP
jgi:universal stress protein E